MGLKLVFIPFCYLRVRRISMETKAFAIILTVQYWKRIFTSNIKFCAIAFHHRIVDLDVSFFCTTAIYLSLIGVIAEFSMLTWNQWPWHFSILLTQPTKTWVMSSFCLKALFSIFAQLRSSSQDFETQIQNLEIRVLWCNINNGCKTCKKIACVYVKAK